jgi:hypothetical protein
MDGPATPANEGVDTVDIEPDMDAPRDHAGDGGWGDGWIGCMRVDRSTGLPGRLMRGRPVV